MMDVSEKGSGSENGGMKVCADCKTSKTPLWRGGPEGPKSLCNACGIRHRKQRRALLGLNNKGVGTTEKKKKIKKKERTKNEVSLKLKLIRVGKKVLLKRSSGLEKQNKLGEEEQAAILLMALSCGCVYG